MNKDKNWKVLEETDVSPSKWFPLFKHKVMLPNKKIINDYYISKLGDVAMIVPITIDGEFVFVRQYKHGVGGVIMEFPAGRIGKNSSEKAARMELKEETGYIAKKLEYLGFVYLTPSKDTSKMNGFLAVGLSTPGKQNLDKNENIEVIRIPANEVDTMVNRGGIIASDTLALLYLTKLRFPELFEKK